MARILVVDDQEQNRKLLLMVLQHGGHEVLAASNGREALAMTRERKPDLIITDLVMPDMGGAELLQAIRADPAIANVRIVLYTASDEDLTARVVESTGGEALLLPKPSEPEAILRFIGEALRARASPAPPSEAARLGAERGKPVSGLLMDGLNRLYGEGDSAQLESVDRFVAILCHDLSNPLNSVLGFADLLLSGALGTLTPKQQRMIQNIRDAGAEQLKLMQQIRAFPKTRQGKAQ